VGPFVYLDHLATTPADPRVVEAMRPWLSERFGHPASRSHRMGWDAEAAVEAARAQVADLLHVEPREIVFTSGGTEADNLAIKGVADAYGVRGRHVVTTAVENRPVLDSCRWLEETRGFAVTRVPCSFTGRVSAENVVAALRPDTILVSVQAANQETGTTQPCAEIAAACAGRNVLVHVDATFAGAWLELDPRRDGVHLMTLSANKLGGPKGAGALYVRRKDPRVRLAPQLHGGSHERGLRAGTVDVAGAVGFGVAASIVRETREAATATVSALRDRLEGALLERVPDAQVHGDRAHRLPNVANLSFAGVEAESLLMGMQDVAASAGAGCTNALVEPSHVFEAMGLTKDVAAQSVRFSLGRATTRDEIDFAIERVVATVAKVRALGAPAIPVARRKP